MELLCSSVEPWLCALLGMLVSLHGCVEGFVSLSDRVGQI